MFGRLIPQHIFHKYGATMAKKSEVVVLDVLYKNEACHRDILDMVIYLLVNDKDVHSKTLWIQILHKRNLNFWSWSLKIVTHSCAYLK